MGDQDERVFIIDDDSEMCKLLKAQVASIGLECETFCDPRRFLESYAHAGPGCIIADIMMPGMTGLQLLEAARSAKIELPVIVLTGYGDVSIAVRAFRTGAFDFLEKPFSKAEFLELIQRALQKSRQMLEFGEENARIEECVAQLTHREQEVVAELVKGDSNKQIARKLNISHRTVERHRQNLMKKLGVRSVLELGAISRSIESQSRSDLGAGRRPGDNVLYLAAKSAAS